MLPHHGTVFSWPDDTHRSSERRRAEIKRGAGIAVPEPPDRGQAVQQRRREQASRTVATSIRSPTNRLPNSGPQYPRCNSRRRPRIQPRRSPSQWGLASRSSLSPTARPATPPFRPQRPLLGGGLHARFRLARSGGSRKRSWATSRGHATRAGLWASAESAFGASSIGGRVWISSAMARARSR